MTISEYKDYLVGWLKECVNNANLDGLIVGVSGGIDSALVANLIKEAFPDNHLGVIIPIESSEEDIKDAYKLVEECNITHIETKLDSVYDSFSKVYNYDNPASLSNMKARLRMTQLYALASEKKYLVVGTDNKCEWHTGYFTKYGDGGVDIAPLIHLTKSQVYEMSRLYDVPNSILEKNPSAGLGSNLSDEEEMGVKYDVLDAYLSGEEIDIQSKNIIDKLHRNSEHKRNLATKPDIKL